ncbi:glycosyltransferase family 2 protein [Vagococcus carniphilus]|uniref:glycosyltransferase family 2 protein n=1 Tax=Vagococcus carniphilus TaxID=218144 RepID=UPI00289222C3|nr:glycosyltransferase family 2 protein [Vagococcus carniphilus]MDT2813653.1 glycosyltransferase family 2 protein [Vagococcus carniphilus]
MKVIFFISIFFIVYAMVGYPLVLKFLYQFLKKDSLIVDEKYEPYVSIIIPVYNEEKVIEKKLVNLMELNYPQDKCEIMIASDNSTDNTNLIVKKYISEYSNIHLVEVKNRKGKTNAQDEAVDRSKGEILVFSDANSILENNAINEITKYMVNEDVSYVAGKLVYTNGDLNRTAETESSYWNYDLEMRKIESELSSITAGNGALYSVRRNDYEKIDPIYSHDSIFPPKFVVKGKKAKFNPNAIAFEKAGENLGDEFKRKIRMSRKIIKINFVDFQKYNMKKCGIFSFFYFSHRFCRNFLFLFHLIALITNVFLINNTFFLILLLLQTSFFFCSFLGIYIHNKYLKVFTYYTMTVLAQLLGAYKEITGKSKPFWEIAESTR